MLKIEDTGTDRLSADDHPLTGGFSRAYYPEVFGSDRIIKSFFITDGRDTLAYVPFTIGEKDADYFGHPIQVFLRAQDQKAANLAVERIMEIAQGRSVVIADTIRSSDSVISIASAAAGLKVSETSYAICDLSLSREQRRASMRRRYRSYVNWGEKNISLRYVNSSNPDSNEFTAYREFHLRVAGRSTRPESSWKAMFDWITTGNGELSLGYWNDELVAGSMIVDGFKGSFYASGVYDRDRFSKPMAHWPMANAIERSAQRGKIFFDIGEVPHSGSDKEMSIGNFKSGFVEALSLRSIWKS